MHLLQMEVVGSACHVLTTYNHIFTVVVITDQERILHWMVGWT